jgi:hypothetical protein
MSEYKKLYKQIGDLNNKIKKLENIVGNKKHSQQQINKNISCVSKSTLQSYRIHFPTDVQSNKKYIGLKFNDNFNNFDSDEKSNSKNLIPFIKLSKSNIIINYTIQLELDYTPLNPIHCSIAIGIKTSIDTKIKIIKGTKYNFDLTGPNTINNKLVISNNVLYSAEDNEELCIIADFDFASGSSSCVVNSKKSIIKILFI